MEYATLSNGLSNFDSKQLMAWGPSAEGANGFFTNPLLAIPGKTYYTADESVYEKYLSIPDNYQFRFLSE